MREAGGLTLFYCMEDDIDLSSTEAGDWGEEYYDLDDDRAGDLSTEECSPAADSAGDGSSPSWSPAMFPTVPTERQQGGPADFARGSAAEHFAIFTPRPATSRSSGEPPMPSPHLPEEPLPKTRSGALQPWWGHFFACFDRGE